MDKQTEIQQPLSHLPQIASVPDESVNAKETDNNWQYFAVHGCDMMDENSHTLKLSEETPTEAGMVSFPHAAKVCEMLENSSLQEFNPLNDSEPNLEFDMTNQNDASKPDLHVKLMQDAKTHHWQVKIRNLSKEQIDFIAGPRLLPMLSKADAVVIDHGANPPVVETAQTATPEVSPVGDASQFKPPTNENTEPTETKASANDSNKSSQAKITEPPAPKLADHIDQQSKILTIQK